MLYDEELRKLNAKITECALCPRLAHYIRQVGREKVKRYAEQEYWSRPLPS